MMYVSCQMECQDENIGFLPPMVKLPLEVVLFFALRNMTGVFPGLSPPEDVLTSELHDAVGLKSGNCSIPSVTNA